MTAKWVGAIMLREEFTCSLLFQTLFHLLCSVGAFRHQVGIAMGHLPHHGGRTNSLVLNHKLGRGGLLPQ